jgi:hypothetical protein
MSPLWAAALCPLVSVVVTVALGKAIAHGQRDCDCPLHRKDQP